MARVRENQPLVPSVLDRLLDRPSATGQQEHASRGHFIRDLKQCVRRDLENMLNTRWRCDFWPPDLDQLDLSLVNYGIPDFTGRNMSLPSEREELRAIIEQVIRHFEPRLESVRITLQESKDEFDRTLHFRIDAMLHAEPTPEPVVFDSQLEPATATFEVKSQNR